MPSAGLVPGAGPSDPCRCTAEGVFRAAMSVPTTADPALASFGSSLMAITLAELGDKTFFMALILEARHRLR